jgi:hypothetical protein
MVYSLLAIIIAVSPSLFSKPSQSPFTTEDEGSFILMLKGQQIGTERFRIHARGDDLEASARIEFRAGQDGNPVDFKTFPDLILNSQLQPISYTWNQKGARSSRLQMDFSPGSARVRYHTVTGQQDDREFHLLRDVIVLDDNVIYQYELAAWRYAMTAGGQQTFTAFIPQEALPGTLTVTEVGKEPIRIGGKKVTCNHLVISTDNARIDLWLDSDWRLERMDRASEQFVAFRQH